MTKGSDTRERILDTAFRMAAVLGLDGLSLSDIATQLGISKSGIFAHFRSKELLQIEMLRTGATKFVETVLAPAFRQPRGLPRLIAAFNNWIQWTNNPRLPGGCLLMAAAVEMDDRDGPVRDVVVSLQRELLASMAKTAGICIEEGHLSRKVDAEQFAFELYGILLSFNHSHRLLRDKSAARRARTAFQRLLDSAAPVSQ
jgi:AcrR family transcriptional regulator